MLLMLACGLGVGALVTGVPALRWAIKITGVAYLLWLANKLRRPANMVHVGIDRLNVSFSQSVGLQILNIKAWMLALTLRAGWVSAAAGQPAANLGQRLAIVCAVTAVFASAATSPTHWSGRCCANGWRKAPTCPGSTEPSLCCW